MAMSIKERREEIDPLKQAVADLMARVAALEAAVHPVIDPQFAEMEDMEEPDPHQTPMLDAARKTAKTPKRRAA